MTSGMFIKIVVAYAVGLIIPGYLLGKSLNSRSPWLTSVPLSILLLTAGVLLLDSAGFAISFGAVLGWELSITLILLFYLFKSKPVTSRFAYRNIWDRISLNNPDRELFPLIAGIALVVLVSVTVAYMVPLSGFDTPFRWDFLAKQLLRYQTLDFYPPVTGKDFQKYFYPDGFPPAVSISYWWVYAAIGKPLPVAVMPLSLLQLFSILGLVYHLGERISSRTAGWLACGILTASPLLFRSVMIGQETGLTALTMMATLSALNDAEDTDGRSPIVLAALLAGVGGFAREYGVILTAGGGLLLLLWRRERGRELALFLMATVALIAPWYLRNCLRCGNPFYNYSFGLFPVNPVYDALITCYKSIFGMKNFGLDEWLGLLKQLIIEAGWQVLVGLPAALWLLRRSGWLTLSILLSIFLWVLSVGYTSGGYHYSMRVLSPALALASITAAMGLDSVFRGKSRMALIAAITLSLLYGAFCAVIFPVGLSQLKGMSAVEIMMTRFEHPMVNKGLLPLLSSYYPQGSRILADNAYLHSNVIDSGGGFDLVPVWSPEVRFLFDRGASPLEQRRRLMSKGIIGAIINDRTVNANFLFEASSFYRNDFSNWLIRREENNLLLARF
jgi:hypothetical protein